MNAELRKLWSLEREDDFSNFSPEDPKNFGTWVRMLIGPRGEAGAESFDIFVCTPSWLASELHKQNAIFPRNHLVIQSFDHTLIASHLSRAVSMCSGRDWLEVAVLLSRLGAWEFEDYKAKTV